MENKVYIIENLGCANCAAKMEAKINALPQVEQATITFATRQLRVTAEDPDALVTEMEKIVQSIEAPTKIVPYTRGKKVHHGEHHHEHHDHCSCGHEHHGHHDHCSCGHEHHGHHDHCSCGHEHHGHHDHCGCGHEHHDHCDCGHEHHAHQEHGQAHDHDHGHGEDDPKVLILGAGLFVLGILCGLLPFGWVGALVHLAAYGILGLPVLRTAAQNLTKGHVFDENFLMSIATLGALVIGEFPEAVGVMLFYRLGEYFEHKAVERSRSQIMQAIDLRPETVNRLHGEAVEVIPAEEARVGDLLLVRPGDRIPLDGVIVSGQSRIDTAPITGEPVPVAAGVGDKVTSGCVNTAAPVTMRVEKPLEESMVTRILDSVENAAAGKPKIDRFITRFSRIYTPVVVFAALATAIIPSIATGNWNYWVYTALSFLVMSCPCALVLSVPLAFFSGIGVGSRQGILFKGGLVMEALADVKAVAMDKTGTVTKGDFSVQEISGGEEILTLCAGCEQLSTHPIAVSIVTAAKERGLILSQPEQLEELSGRGIRATVDGKQVLCGNALLMQETGVDISHFPQLSGTVVLVAVDGAAKGWIRIADTVKANAAQAVSRLKEQGIETAMFTGDNEETACQVAKETGISQVFARLLPQQKLEKLQQLRQGSGAVMFVGDGINDAPVLAGADVGAAMGAGADAAIEAADVVFLTNDVNAIPESISIAAQTRKVAWQNVIFALAVKFLVMILGLLGHASMWMAVFADSGVAMLCVLNSIRMLYRKR